jgi:hypothetical protein
MKYAVDMGSGAVIYVPSFISIDSGIHRHTVSIEMTYDYFRFFKIIKIG